LPLSAEPNEFHFELLLSSGSLRLADMFAKWPILAERSPLRRMSTAGLTRPVAGNYANPDSALPHFSGDAFSGCFRLTKAGSAQRSSMTIRRPILQTSIVLSPRVRSVNSYYKVEGAADSVLISLPKGRYVLAFAGRQPRESAVPTQQPAVTCFRS
jgi:hypothetical protein